MNCLAPVKNLVDVKAKDCLIAEACNNAQEGQTSWMMRLVADRLAE
jgi:hypothetical protein